MLQSIVCRFEHFSTDWHERWFRELALSLPPTVPAHRKHWEWTAIAQALFERGAVTPGNSGLGFAVGTEPMVSWFAAKGCRVTATDIGDGPTAEAWRENDEHAESANDLHYPEIVDRSDFSRLVGFQNVDMNILDALPRGAYDFVWSSCALEHLGTLRKGTDFILNSMELLKPGGVAVHTTEFNLTSPTETIEEGGNVLYRRSDLEQLELDLKEKECTLEPLDLDPGSDEEDLLHDFEPYYEHGRAHVKLELPGGWVVTSVLLIATKG